MSATDVRPFLSALTAITIAAGLAVDAAGDLRLLDAVKRQDIAAVRSLLEAHVDVNAAAADGSTPLHWAVYQDQLELTDLLLGAGAKPDAANQLGIGALSLACDNANAEIVARLVAAGATVNPAGAPVPPIMLCARTGDRRAVDALVAAKADVNASDPRLAQTALMWAAARNHAEIVRVLLQHGASVRARSRITQLVINRANPNDPSIAVLGQENRGGSTALLFAARNGSVEAAAALLEAGANANDVAPDGATPLVVAALSNQTALAELLLRRGANPNVIGAGYTALHAAVLRGNLSLVTSLVAGGGLINSRVRHGTATSRGTQDYFLPESLTGATPFWLAARFLEVDIMRALARAGADTRLGLPDGTTALMAAAGVPAQLRDFDRRERPRLPGTSDEALAMAAVTVALDAGGDVGAANAAGDTALHGAAAQDYPDVVALLVRRGASVSVKNVAGKTPLAVAAGDRSRTALRRAGAQ